MECFECDALCIKAIDYKDNDKIITLYCGERGKITVNAKGCKSAKAKLKFAVSPFCFGKYNLTNKVNRYTLIGCECYDSFFHLTANLDTYYAGMVVLEILDKMSMDSDYNHGLFVASLTALKELAYGEIPPKKLIFDYLMQATLLLGYHIQAIKLGDIHRYYANNFDCQLNSLKSLISLV